MPKKGRNHTCPFGNPLNMLPLPVRPPTPVRHPTPARPPTHVRPPSKNMDPVIKETISKLDTLSDLIGLLLISDSDTDDEKEDDPFGDLCGELIDWKESFPTNVKTTQEMKDVIGALMEQQSLYANREIFMTEGLRKFLDEYRQVFKVIVITHMLKIRSIQIPE